MEFFTPNERPEKNIPPTILAESRRSVYSGDWYILFVLGALTKISESYKETLDAAIPFGRYVWIVGFVACGFFIIKVTSKINWALQEKGTDVVREHNKFQSAQLFQEATKRRPLSVWSIDRIVLGAMVVIAHITVLAISFLLFYTGIFKNIPGHHLVSGLFFLIIGGPTFFMFYLRDKSILDGARAKNQFVEIAEKRWQISKNIFVLVIVAAFCFAGILIYTDRNFTETGLVHALRGL